MKRFALFTGAIALSTIIAGNVLAERGYIHLHPLNRDQPSLKPDTQKLDAEYKSAFPMDLSVEQLRQMEQNDAITINHEVFHLVITDEVTKALTSHKSGGFAAALKLKKDNKGPEGTAVLIPDSIEYGHVPGGMGTSILFYIAKYKFIKPTKEAPVPMEVWYHVIDGELEKK